MLKRVLLVTGALLALGVLIAAAGLVWAHQAIRRERPPLPSADTLLAASGEGGPVRLSYINTASQPMPRSGVLDTQDPRPQDAYVMSHPSFVLEWPDGKLLLVDVGMRREAAEAFGSTIETMGGAQPIQAHGSVAERLGTARKRVAAAVFTHLHPDHVDGMTALCATPEPIRVFMTPAQAGRPNYTTRPGLQILHDSPCVRAQQLPDTALAPLPDFPGAYVIAAGGHTPGSQIIVANLQTANGPRRVAFVGARLDELRRWLRTLRDTHGVQLLVAHDQLDIERNAIPTWPGG
jgi:glyoxylase-like metal-dependent hydrolase (beta-lactamase superfamily II)